MKQLCLKSFLAVLFMVMGITATFAQTVTVQGTVSDNLGPVIGVSVLEKGTTNGVITDVDGNFTLQVQQGAILEFSYVGYVSVEKKVTGGA